VSQLAGKTDVIPGITNTTWIDPRREGVSLGNGEEYCGTQYSNMLLRVVVDSPPAFEKWASAQKLDATVGSRMQLARATLLSLSCINCHAVSGTSATGTFGPDLSHLMSRATLGSGVIPNTAQSLCAWVKDPQTIKRGNLMPNSRELDEIVTYLSSLK
jgi:cytochrome c oxidase subunit 2